MYALVSLLSLVVAASFAATFAQRRRRWLPVFVLSGALLIYTHNWGLFLLTGSVVALGWLWQRSGDRRALVRDAAIGYGLIALLYLPWVPALVSQVHNTGAPWSFTPSARGVVRELARERGTVTTASFLRAVNRTAGRNFSAAFARHVFRGERPVLDGGH